MIVQVIKVGLYTSLQDVGRSGYAHQGIPQGGAMDLESFELCNMILGNDSSQPVMECTLLGPTLSFDNAAQIAITGSDLSPMINNIPVVLNKAIGINSGDQLSFGRLKHGCRCYIGIAGEWKVARWQGSVSPLTYGRVLSENVLKKGSKIEINTTPKSEHPTIEIQKTVHESIDQLEVYMGPEFDLFEDSAIDQFLSNTYVINNASNRMGYRLDGDQLDTSHIPPMVSAGVLPGTIQITSGGTPIILGRDAQTVGGYPRIAITSETSLNHLAHIKPKDQVKFSII